MWNILNRIYSILKIHLTHKQKLFRAFIYIFYLNLLQYHIFRISNKIVLFSYETQTHSNIHFYLEISETNKRRIFKVANKNEILGLEPPSNSPSNRISISHQIRQQHHKTSKALANTRNKQNTPEREFRSPNGLSSSSPIYLSASK